MPTVALRGRQPAPIAPRRSHVPRNNSEPALRRIRGCWLPGHQNEPKPLRHKALVALATVEGKDIAVYFQRVRRIAPRHLPPSQGVAPSTSAAGGLNICLVRTATMPAIDPDDLPKKKITHEIGQELALLSVGELTERIAFLQEEIARLEAEMKRKNASKSAADMFFKK